MGRGWNPFFSKDKGGPEIFNSEKFMKNVEKFWKIPKKSAKFGKIQEFLGQIAKIDKRAGWWSKSW